MKILYVLGISVFLIFGYGQATSASPQDEAEIRKLIEGTYVSNVRSGDGERYSSIFSKGALWMPPKSKDRSGQKDIAAGFSEMVREIRIEPVLIVDDIQGITPTLAYVVGKAQVLIRPKDGSSPKSIKLRMMWIMNKDSGKWMIARQIWNQKP